MSLASVALALLAFVLLILWGRRQRYREDGGFERAMHILGAPPLPWPLRPEDRQLANRISSEFALHGLQTNVVEVSGQTGASLELLLAGAPKELDPVAIIGPTWNPDDWCVATMATFSGTVVPGSQLDIIMTSAGFVRLSPPEMEPTVFVG